MCAAEQRVSLTITGPGPSFLSFLFSVEISERGEAGATSSLGRAYLPENANTGRYHIHNRQYWASHDGDKFPQTIWIQYQQPHCLAKIDIRSSWNYLAPKNFQVVGSTEAGGWETLLSIDDSGFSIDGQKEVRSWEIPDNMRRPLTRFGVKTNSILGGSKRWVEIKQIVLHEETFI